MATKNKYRTFMREEQLEKEIEDLEAAARKEMETQEQVEADKDENLTPEDKTFKKRYGDLRSYTDKKLREKDEENQRLKEQLEAASEKQIQFPKTEEEVTEWMEKYPDLGGIFKTIALKEVQKTREEVDKRFLELSEKEKRVKMELAYRKLLSLHPDFEEIKDTEEFQTWVQSKHEWVYKALYENDTDAELAAEAVNLYKFDMEKKTKKSQTPATRDTTAHEIRTSPGTPPSGGDTPRFTESMVRRMNQRDYEKHEEEIDAIRTNTPELFYDISGGAR